MHRAVACSLAAPFLLSAALSVPAAAAPVRIATWNIEHLRAENDTGAVRRRDEDYRALAALAARLDADIIALQEVDGPAAAARVFDPIEYRFAFSDRNDRQRTGFAIRRDIEIVADDDFVELSLDGRVRHGTDVTVRVDGQSLRLLSVHLKSGCFEDALDSADPDCPTLARQVPILEDWIDARTQEDVPFVVLGDFNRRFNVQGDEVFPEIDDAEPPGLDLVLTTEGLTSACLDGRFPEYIDHIVLDEQAARFLVQGSFRQIPITEADEAMFALSDHCPIAVDLALTDGPNPDPRAQAKALFEDIRDLVRETNEKVGELERLLPELE